MRFTPTQMTPSDMSKPITTAVISVRTLSPPPPPFLNLLAISHESEASILLKLLIRNPGNDVRQCLIYDSAGRDARLIGIEYMIAPHLYESLPQEERRLWHSHVYEVKSGMLVMPNRTVPTTVWDAAERKEMEEVITLYGKTYHLWQTDRGDKLPLGEPKLMTSFTADGQLDAITMKQRDEKFGISCKDKKASRADIRSPKIHPGMCFFTPSLSFLFFFLIQDSRSLSFVFVLLLHLPISCLVLQSFLFSLLFLGCVCFLFRGEGYAGALC